MSKHTLEQNVVSPTHSACELVDERCGTQNELKDTGGSIGFLSDVTADCLGDLETARYVGRERCLLELALHWSQSNVLVSIRQLSWDHHPLSPCPRPSPYPILTQLRFSRNFHGLESC